MGHMLQSIAFTFRIDLIDIEKELLEKNFRFEKYFDSILSASSQFLEFLKGNSLRPEIRDYFFTSYFSKLSVPVLLNELP